MRRKLSILAATIVLGIVGLFTASAAHAGSIYAGGYATFEQCQSIKQSYVTYGGKTILKSCYRANQSAYPWYFTYWDGVIAGS